MPAKRSILMPLSALLALAVLVEAILYFTIPADASPEYRYTIGRLGKFFALPGAFAITAAALFMAFKRSFKRGLACLCAIGLAAAGFYFGVPDSAAPEYRRLAARLFPCVAALAFWAAGALWLYRRCGKAWALGLAGLACLFAPVLGPEAVYIHWIWGVLYSLLWLFGALALGLFCFIMAGRIKNFTAGIFSVLGTLFLLFSAAESCYLALDQPEDGRYEVSWESRHVRADEARAGFNLVEKKVGVYPAQPSHPSHASAKAFRRYNQELYDVKYTFDKNGHRIVPVNPENPEADLLLFGCSYTFGEALEDEEAWAWKLSQDLGPDWRVTNYSFSAFGAQQMLGMLEDDELEPAPSAPLREALFFGIWHQIFRHTGLVFPKRKSVRYIMENGRPVQAGYTTESPLRLIAGIPEFFNGSQAARGLSNIITSAYMTRFAREHMDLYAAMLVRSSRLLKEKYNARLTVLLWDDLEGLAPALEKEGLPVLFVNKLFKTPGDLRVYQIMGEYEGHPNQRAADEIAEGLSAYYKKLLRGRPGAGGAPD